MMEMLAEIERMSALYNTMYLVHFAQPNCDLQPQPHILTKIHKDNC